METIDKRKKDRLIKGVVLNALVFLGCIIYIIVIILPKYDSINAMTLKINSTITDTSSLKKDGVDKNTFIELLNRSGRKKEVPESVFSDTDKLNKVLLKPATEKQEYLAWLTEQNGKINTLDKEIQENDAILGNIIPVFVNTSVNTENDIDNKITIASFISYIEKNILGKYSLTSYAPLGISNITFPDKKDSPVNIGSFKITLDFKGKNNNIRSFVDALQNSGKFSIRNGKLSASTNISTVSSKEKGISSLSNLLIGVSAFSLDAIPDSDSNDNNGSITLEFYVEGMNYQKVLILRSLLLGKFEGLQKSIKEKGLLCAKSGNSLCNETITASAISTIKGLIKNLSSLQLKIDSLKKGGIVIDANTEMDTLSDIKTSLQMIEMIYLKNNAILEKAKKQSNTK